MGLSADYGGQLIYYSKEKLDCQPKIQKGGEQIKNRGGGMSRRTLSGR